VVDVVVVAAATANAPVVAIIVVVEVIGASTLTTTPTIPVRQGCRRIRRPINDNNNYERERNTRYKYE
jgi:hypothetical protein